MTQVINSGSLVKVKTAGHPLEGHAGMALGGSVAPGHETVNVKFDLDESGDPVEVNTDDLQVLGS